MFLLKRIQFLLKLLQAIGWIDLGIHRGSFLHDRIDRGAGIDVRSRGNVVGFDVLILRWGGGVAAHADRSGIAV